MNDEALNKMRLQTEIGFTGTQNGMTRKQMVRMLELMDRLNVNTVHHGDCIGADAEMDALCELFGVWRVSHPPTKTEKRAYCDANEILDPRPYLKRDHDIVDASRVLFAAPGTGHELLRSGTWATIRYARRKRIPRWIVFPNGQLKGEEYEVRRAAEYAR